MAQEKVVTIEPSFVDDRGSIINVFARKEVKKNTEMLVQAHGSTPHPEAGGGLWADITLTTIIHTKKGSVRGNHYHRAEWQYLYVVKGSFESTSVDARAELELGGKDGIGPVYIGLKRTWLTVREGQLIMTPPYVAHRAEFLEDTILLCGVTANRLSMDQDDTFPYEVLP